MNDSFSNESDLIARQAANEAAAWLARLNSRVIDTTELEEFFAWRRIPHNGKAYDEIESHWRGSLKLANDPDVILALQAASSPKHASGRIKKLALAAGLAALMACAAFFLLARDTIFETAIGEQRLVQLDDGSRVQLDTDTRISVDMGAKRMVRLHRGRAFFDVAHDSSRPFLVSASDARIEALGTRFEIDAAHEAIQVALIEGRVAVSAINVRSGSSRVELNPGQAVTVAGAGVSEIVAADTLAVTAWTQGRLEFRETPLAQAVGEVNRYARTPLRLKSIRWAGQRVNGGFAVGDVQAFVEAVTTLYPLVAITRPDGSIELHDR